MTWALVNGSTAALLVDGQPFVSGAVQYPGNVTALWSAADLATIGVLPVVDDAIPAGQVATGSSLEISAGKVLRRWTLAAAPVQTVFAPGDLMTRLFTPAEQIGFAAKPQGVLFIGLIAAHQSIDITSAEFRADVAQAVAGGFLTQARADQVLAGAPAPSEAGA